MAKTPSDVLAVHLLLKKRVSGLRCRLLRCLKLSMTEQRQRCHDPAAEYRLVSRPVQGKQMVMIGYSDSAKDAGVWRLPGRNIRHRMH